MRRYSSVTQVTEWRQYAMRVTATAVEAWTKTSLLPDLRRRRYILETKTAVNNNEREIKETKLH